MPHEAPPGHSSADAVRVQRRERVESPADEFPRDGHRLGSGIRRARVPQGSADVGGGPEVQVGLVAAAHGRLRVPGSAAIDRVLASEDGACRARRATPVRALTMTCAALPNQDPMTRGDGRLEVIGPRYDRWCKVHH